VTSSSTILRPEAPAGDPARIARGDARFWRVNFALFLGSFATFALLYCVQPLMPGFTRAFSISPAAASLSLSAATGVLAVAMICAGTLSDALGRKAVMTASLAAAAAATLAASFSPNWTTFVALRALTGFALSGVPAVAMAYLVEEMDRSAIGLAMGLYIAGNTLGAWADAWRALRSPTSAVGAGRSLLSALFRSAARPHSPSRCRGSRGPRRGRERQRSCRRFAPISAIRASGICSPWASY
jgi:MFS family permease